MTFLTSFLRLALATLLKRGKRLGRDFSRPEPGVLGGHLLGPLTSRRRQWFYHCRSGQNACTPDVCTCFAACFSPVPTWSWAQERSFTPPLLGGAAAIAAPFLCRAGTTFVVVPARHDAQQHIKEI
jgi:hypothetical protein